MEVWEALRVDTILEAGRTCPLVVECISPVTYQRRRFVVKALGLPEVHTSGLFCELFGNWLARKVGVDTPEPVLVSISEDFAEASRSAISRHAGLAETRLASGFGAGCEYITHGMAPIARDGEVADNQLARAMRVYGFDLMVQNVDRSFSSGHKPNCAQIGDRLIAYDFEMSFSFLFAIGERVPAWAVSRLSGNTTHIFYRQLRRAARERTVDCEGFVSDVSTLSISEMEQVVQSFPESWLMHSTRVLEHIAEILDNIPAFRRELIGSLS